jgi:K+-sensing histidine kinase KdpD/CheY-like chemotaxis protein
MAGKREDYGALLVVGGCSDFRRSLDDLLPKRKERVIEAATAAQAADIAVGAGICAAVIDLDSPEIPGTEFFGRLRKLRPDLPIIVISSCTDFAAVRDALRIGVLDYLTRPLHPVELNEAIDRAVTRHAESVKIDRMEREARRRLSDLVLLRELGETASTGENLQILFEKILDSIQMAADVEIASLMLVDEADGSLRIRAARGLPAEIVAAAQVLPGEGISGHVAAAGEPVLIDDIFRNDRFLSSGGSQKYRTSSLLSVPIRSRDRVIGVLNVNNKRSGEKFTIADRNLLGTIAHQAGLAIANFQLVSDLRRRTRDLEETNTALRKLHQLRSRLVCSLSHELNTPLTSVVGYLDLLLDADSALSDFREYLHSAYDEALRMEQVINGMLRLFSIDSGMEEWDQEYFPLGQLVEEILRAQSARMESMAILVDIDMAPDLPDIFGDREKTSILLGALIDNAVKFNRRGGVLQIAAETCRIEGREHISLRMHNDGRSVPVESHEDIFAGFTQLGDMDTEKPQGLGIGLALCRAIIGGMGGKIFLLPHGGEGTTFGLLLPVGASHGERIDG